MEITEFHFKFIAEGDTINPHSTFRTQQGGIQVECPKGKYAWMIKIGEKGQFVIPKEARALFGFQPGQTILVLGDEKKGLAIPPRAESQRIMNQIFDELQKEDE